MSNGSLTPALVETFAGDTLPPCAAISRTSPERRIQRGGRDVATPSAWFFLLIECCGAPKGVAWDSWQAVASCTWGEVIAFRQRLLLWATLPDAIDGLTQRGISPQEIVKVLELLGADGRLSLNEINILETCIFAHVNQDGGWC